MPADVSSSRPDLLAGKTVAIVGGGPAGLTLARLLQLHGASVRVFERDPSQEARAQGGSLDLHEGTGQLAIQKAGLEAKFRGVSRPEGQAFKLLDQKGVIRLEHKVAPGEMSRPEIDRGELRRLFLDALAKDTVIWDHQLERVEPGPGESHRLFFKNGAAHTADLVVGCDGLWSKVRPLVSALRPAYTGISFIEARLTGVDESHPAIARLVGQGAILALGGHKGLWAQRNGDQSIRVYFSLQVPEQWVKQDPFDYQKPETVRARLLEVYADWALELTALLRAADDWFQPWMLYSFPPDQSWETTPGVTLIGDAAHVMTPFTGEGANQAMFDAVELADCLTSGRFPTLTQALHAFEQGMFKRMKPAMAQTFAQQALAFADDAPDGTAAAMARYMESPPPSSAP